ncbi:ShlB/FhaC/HecB family hemolysin secretion/activation protein [Xenorhabdus nematophila]|uniref:ShlB/FhaC/HecB family hemolysin secretion/activation protein n=1 Tax=Xenorhabdus nematophila TaxID=628 RepID=UPI000543C425
MLGGYFSFNPTYTRGLDIFNATKDDSKFKDSPKSQFNKLSVSTSYYKFLKNDVYYLTSFYGQYSPTSLFSSERISLGSQYSIRGFKGQSIMGNTGGYWRNEFNWKLPQTPRIGNLSLNSSLDVGWIKKEKLRGSDGGNLVGTSLGLTLNNSISSHSITLGKPLKYPQYLKPDNWVIYWSTSFDF